MNKTIHDVCEGLLEEACIMWERDEGVMTTSFAIGHSRSLFAQPISEEGLEIEPDARVQMHALLASSAGAIFLGRIDESYIAERPASAPPLSKGDLERMAGGDPSIRTAVVVQATDTRSGESLVVVAVPVIAEDGSLIWEHNSFEDADGQVISDAMRAVAMADLIVIPATDAQLREQMREIGWTVADSDDMSRDSEEG